MATGEAGEATFEIVASKPWDWTEILVLSCDGSILRWIVVPTGQDNMRAAWSGSWDSCWETADDFWEFWARAATWEGFGVSALGSGTATNCWESAWDACWDETGFLATASCCWDEFCDRSSINWRRFSLFN